MRKAMAVGTAIFVICSCAALFAMEAPTTVLSEVPGETATNWLNLLIALETVWKVIGLLGSTLITWIFWLIGTKIGKDEANKAAMTVIQEAVMATYLEFVQELKRGAADGKLSKADVRAARELAYKKALESAKGPAKDLIISWGKEKAMGIIQLVVDKIKKKKAV